MHSLPFRTGGEVPLPGTLSSGTLLIRGNHQIFIIRDSVSRGNQIFIIRDSVSRGSDSHQISIRDSVSRGNNSHQISIIRDSVSRGNNSHQISIRDSVSRGNNIWITFSQPSGSSRGIIIFWIIGQAFGYHHLLDHLLDHLQSGIRVILSWVS